MQIFNSKTKVCPACGKEIDSLSPVNGEVVIPRKDDLSICIGCGVFLVFNEQLELHVMSTEEMNKLPQQIFMELSTIHEKIAEMNEGIYGTTWPSIVKTTPSN